jgi:hypothetical protein
MKTTATAIAIGLIFSPVAVAYAEPSIPTHEFWTDPQTGDLYQDVALVSEAGDLLDTLPVCSVEDCSDQPNQIGMWLDRDTGNWYLEEGEFSTFLVIDDTVTR